MLFEIELDYFNHYFCFRACSAFFGDELQSEVIELST